MQRYPQRPGPQGRLTKESGKCATWNDSPQAGSGSGRNAGTTDSAQGWGACLLRMDDWKPKANPLIDGRREKLERECLQLCAEEAKDSGRDGFEVMADASRYKGQSAVNPASMTDDRLIHTILELRAARKWRREQSG